jgi:hypothetical protein
VRAAACVLLAACLTAAACGGSSGSTEERSGGGGQPAAGTLEALWRAPGEDVAIIPGTSDYEPGPLRLSFLVVDKQSRAIFRPTAKVWIARGLNQKPFAETVAKRENIGVPGGDKSEAPAIYVANLNVPSAGKYWVLAEPVGGQKIQALGNLVVGKKSKAPGAGERVPASDTPTIASTGGDFSKLTTRTPPDRRLLRYSVADSLRAKAPFVVSFATPKFCTSRTCGPVVDVVDEVATKFAGSPVRFIHVEIYKDNDPTKGTNRWVNEWKLPTEPFTFLVGRDGRVKAKLEGAFSAGELERLVREKLQ